MALKRLPNDVQSLICASAQVNSYKRAIEELIYNSLDAKSTSIAIRIHIQESTIQVIDNGYGITKDDFNVIGQRYMTSKLTDVATLKAAPENYGYRGEFLANIITVSQTVKITSRHEMTEETFAKCFVNGKEKKFSEMTTRPTKGTTVDIKGFLYNLNIQKRGIDSVNELQNIKLFLEQLSLVHNEISLSLRDDYQNEIVFKIHKKRDIYQTLLSVFEIDKNDMQELQVEKHEFKVKGFIGKMDKDLDLHWIYLNGTCIHDRSRLHKVLNEHFKKSLHIKDQRTLKSKKNNDEHRLFNKNIPFYFIFVTCPYIHYDISYSPNQSVLQFKNWEPINKLLEKLVKFYVGDVNLKEMNRVEGNPLNKERINTKSNQNTRDQVKKIMDKILGNNPKKLGVSQLQNGVKGKIIKRKSKKKTNSSAIVPNCFLEIDCKYNNDDIASTNNKIDLISEHKFEHHIDQQPVDDSHKQKAHKMLKNSRHLKKTIEAPGLNNYKAKEMTMKTKKKELKANILSATKKKISVKQKHTQNKHRTIKLDKIELKYLKSADSVFKRSNLVAQEVEGFLINQLINKRNKIKMENQWKNANKKVNKSTMILEKENYAYYDNKPRTPKANKHIIKKYILNKIRIKPYKTTYDLVQTVLKSQQLFLNTSETNVSTELNNKFYKQNNTLRCKSKVAWTNKYVYSNEYSNISGKKAISQYTTYIPAQYKENSSDYLSLHGQRNDSAILTNEEENIYCHNRNIYCTRKETSYRTSNGEKVLTYDSHQYYNNEVFTKSNTKNCYTSNKRQHVRFITKESRDNLVTSNGFKNKLKKSFGSNSNNHIKALDAVLKQTINESYAIGYSKSNENNYNPTHSYTPQQEQQHHNNSIIFNKDVSFKHASVHNEPVTSINNLNSDLGNTYTIRSSNSSHGKNFATENYMERRQNSQSLHEYYSAHNSYCEANEDKNGSKTTKDDFAYNNKSLDSVFGPKSQQCSETVPLDNIVIVEPLNVCETVFYEIGSEEKEFAVSFNENNLLNDSLYGNIQNSIDKHAINGHDILITQNNDKTENVSHHFTCAVNTVQVKLQDPIDNDQIKINNRVLKSRDSDRTATEGNFGAEPNDCNFVIDFNLKNRLRFVPKGMSQIFENCRTKTARDYDMNKDYFEDSIYNNFANVVQVNSEIYEPIIQNVEDLTTRNIHKFQNKVKKDNASLVFDETSLKNAKVLGQADSKFIVAILKKRCSQTKEASGYLILFDQHAVDERIRLEKNLADYLNQESWTGVAVDNIILKMSKDEILYLHNYKDKFTQLGLQWTILNGNEVTVHSIPEAILGKNPREVEKVIKAVRNLIIEEINIMKLQKGCVSLYPKSIMDLVFSESCRYAIKFGDHLSKSDCVELIKALSNCKTPFQCAHGRPVMAVIMDIIADKREYKISMEALRRFRKRNRRNLQSN